MPAPLVPPTVDADYETLAEDLSALAYATRLELLEVLRFPQALSEIRVAARRAGPSDSPERMAARQTVQGHLEKLVDADLVRAETSEEASRPVTRYVVNRQRLYALVEELLRLSVLRAGGPAGADDTGTLGDPTRASEVKGPRLVLVHGVYVGKAFPLDAKHAVDGRWTLGRRKGLPVSLDYDPWVSLENAAVVQKGDAFEVQDLGSKNGTHVGWARLPERGSRVLKAGDIVGVGRSLLVFVPA